MENNLRFPGQYLDQETGLHQNYFHTYDPSLGRYRQADPIGLTGGMNLYPYADNVGNRIAMKRMVVTLSASPPSPQVSGAAVTFTASAVGGTGPYEYEFQERVEGGSFVGAQPYSQSSNWTWNTTGSPAGGYDTSLSDRASPE